MAQLKKLPAKPKTSITGVIVKDEDEIKEIRPEKKKKG